MKLVEPKGYYAHLSNQLPCYVAGGVWNNQGYYSSWFENAKPIADEYAAPYSTEQLVFRMRLILQPYRSIRRLPVVMGRRATTVELRMQVHETTA